MTALPGSSLDVDTFRRLRQLEHQYRFLPCGGGRDGKAPLISDWPNSDGFTIDQLAAFPNIKSIGVITHPLLCFDVDGESAEEFILESGRDPNSVNTWRVNRTTDPYRYKLLFLPTAEQLSQLPNGQLTHKHPTKPAQRDADGNLIAKAEAEEIFCIPGRQVIVAGAHPSSQGFYFWPVGQGPEALTAPPADWWSRVLEVARDYPKPAFGANRVVNGRRALFSGSDWERISHCPVCGRGPDDNPLCQLHRDGETLRCFLGSTFSPPTNLERGQLVPGTDWAFSRVSSSGWGEFLTFVKDKPSPLQILRRGGWING